MKRLKILLLTLLVPLSVAQADIVDRLLNHYPDGVITDEQAEEMGMTELSVYQKQQKDMQDYLTSINANLSDDETNKHRAKVVVIINDGVRTRSNPEGQTLKLYKNGKLMNKFDVSTASRTEKVTTSGRRYIAVTPNGFFRPKRAYREYYSYTFFGGLMRYAVFITGGVATHTTTSTQYLGTRASAGCVRMWEDEAQLVNEAVVEVGEPHRNFRTEKICKSGVCYPRELYTNRYKLSNVDRWSGNKAGGKLWTYDSLIIVKPN